MARQARRVRLGPAVPPNRAPLPKIASAVADTLQRSSSDCVVDHRGRGVRGVPDMARANEASHSDRRCDHRPVPRRRCLTPSDRPACPGPRQARHALRLVTVGYKRRDVHARARVALLKLRKNLPPGVRRPARLTRLIFHDGRGSPELPTELIANCRMCASRYDLVAALPSHGRVLEVGLYGDFGRHNLDACSPSELHLID